MEAVQILLRLFIFLIPGMVLDAILRKFFNIVHFGFKSVIKYFVVCAIIGWVAMVIVWNWFMSLAVGWRIIIIIGAILILCAVVGSDDDKDQENVDKK